VGLPQIILAQWFDLYDMAVRAEYRGIGIYGNKNVAPDIEAVEFGTAVARLVRPGMESEGFRTRANIRKISRTYERPSFLTGFPCQKWALMTISLP